MIENKEFNEWRNNLPVHSEKDDELIGLMTQWLLFKGCMTIGKNEHDDEYEVIRWVDDELLANSKSLYDCLVTTINSMKEVK